MTEQILLSNPSIFKMGKAALAERLEKMVADAADYDRTDHDDLFIF
eukprot:CAMPEP_0170188186 /NCGR_PEP_ID=MMETSP0040_2-20121228/43693_1 /TAXON_ID=641309 /ORGANISM="Lotharella oceanica, Strain CCMP622" /LENGTH=45 /DNA_ID= /DNA_START= /DNA_END= /DNA_ORIENTATION=